MDFQGDIDAAREIFSFANKSNSNSENIWLAAVKLEIDHLEFDKAKSLFQMARTCAPTKKIIMKNVKLEWALGNLWAALELLERALNEFEPCSKLWMMKGKIEEQQGEIKKAVNSYKEGVS